MYAVRSRAVAEFWEDFQDMAEELRPELNAARKRLFQGTEFAAESAGNVAPPFHR